MRADPGQKAAVELRHEAATTTVIAGSLGRFGAGLVRVLARARVPHFALSILETMPPE